MIEHLGSYELFEQESDQVDRELQKNFKPSVEHIDQSDIYTEADRSVEWVELGYQNIPINKIDVSLSHVRSPSDFGGKGISYEEMKRGLGILESEVRPAIEGEGAGREYFEQLDRSQPLDGSVSRTKVYDSFYGEKISSIRVAIVGDHYEVENGYHRIFTAQELNISSIPAWVKVRV